MKSTMAYLNSNGGSSLIALGEKDRFVADKHLDFAQFQKFIDAHRGAYVFTGLSYDLKEELLGVSTANSDFLNFPKVFAWVPELVADVKDNQITEVKSGKLSPEFQKQIDHFFEAEQRTLEWHGPMKARTSKEQYLEQLESLRNEIQYGSIYEVNFCQEFYNDNFELKDPEAAYFRLNNITRAPFSAYVSFDSFSVLCGSPERFIKRNGIQLLSQPIKGTRKRSNDPIEDAAMKEELLSDPKEIAENVMIVDLVRNDLSRVAEKSSVAVDELFGIYSFNTVHQMISTISCQIAPNISFTDILKATFPMGSMTGAPKKSAVSLIESHENFKRGLYSGSLGYIAPNGDFDFNVVIRSLLYNSRNNYLSCAVGGAITIQSDPYAEYEECNTKVKTILDRMQHG